MVLGYALTFDASVRDQSSACVQHPLGLAVIRRGDDHADDPFFQATGAICSLPILTQAAGASGFLNAAPDPDGLLQTRSPAVGARRSGLSRASRWRPSSPPPARVTSAFA